MSQNPIAQIWSSLLELPRGSSICIKGAKFKMETAKPLYIVELLFFYGIGEESRATSRRWGKNSGPRELYTPVPSSIYWAPSRELQEGAPFLGNGILAPYIFRSYDKKFQKSTINICLVVCILVFAPQVYIELPLGSSTRELHFWAMGYWLLTYSWAMIKNFRSLRSIFALSFAF